MFRRYDVRDQRDDKSPEAALPRVAQAQIGRRLGNMLWTPDEAVPPAFQDALAKIKSSLS